ncbi:hypothetical protein SLEP1_g26221 [Rubroshorea leprosula]|uniref:Uncharacterized protein n=1 Tax=Rubroshorea leprosula TaxID=152421 RepID=A0AAV5JTF7_9ROSI|nr:hypothetical protein SLEP1_g26221 [Rubroshorea leprosula]
MRTNLEIFDHVEIDRNSIGIKNFLIRFSIVLSVSIEIECSVLCE